MSIILWEHIEKGQIMTKWTKEGALAELGSLLEEIPELASGQRFSAEHTRWKTATLTLLEDVFGPSSRYYREFLALSWQKLGRAYFTGIETLNIEAAIENAHYREFLKQLEFSKGLLLAAYDELEHSGLDDVYRVPVSNLIPKRVLQQLCDHFHEVALQLRQRYEDRQTLVICDEHDVRDLFHALLCLHFEDIRVEEKLLNQEDTVTRTLCRLVKENIVIEIMKTDDRLNDEEIMSRFEQTADYLKKQANNDTLFCFVYDPEGRIVDRFKMKNDLKNSRAGLSVEVFVRPLLREK